MNPCVAVGWQISCQLHDKRFKISQALQWKTRPINAETTVQHTHRRRPPRTGTSRQPATDCSQKRTRGKGLERSDVEERIGTRHKALDRLKKPMGG